MWIIFFLIMNSCCNDLTRDDRSSEIDSRRGGVYNQYILQKSETVPTQSTEFHFFKFLLALEYFASASQT